MTITALADNKIKYIVLSVILVICVLLVCFVPNTFSTIALIISVLAPVFQFVKDNKSKDPPNPIEQAISLPKNTPRTAKNFSVYNYKYRTVDFVGREDVMAKLDSFMAPEPRFQWWALYGEAGSGKSRTALELCLKYEKEGWLAGFVDLKKTKSEDWQTWRPKRKTLLVVDYAASHLTLASAPAEPLRVDIKAVLLSLCEEQKNYKHSVRVLLLERFKEESLNNSTDFNQPLHKRLTADSSADCADLGQTQFEKHSTIILPEIEPNYLKAIGRSVSTKWPENFSEDDFIEKFKELDPGKMRPLFAIMLAVFLDEGKTTGDLGRETVLKETLLRDSGKYWKGLDKDDLKLLILATICGGLNGLPDGVNLPNLWDIENESARRHKFDNCGLSQHREAAFTLNPIEPDLLGEYFVLSAYQPIAQSLGIEEIPEKTIHNLIWQAANYKPDETVVFLRRCMTDFGSQKLENLHTYFMAQSAQSKTDASQLVGRLVVDGFIFYLALDYGNAGKLEEAEKLYTSMAELGHEPEIAVGRAKAAFNLITAYGTAGKLEEAEKLYTSMAELGHEPEIAVLRAKAAVNLSITYGTAGKLEEAGKLYTSMAELGHEPEIAVERAKAAFNLITAYGRAGKLEEAGKLYTSMAELGHEPEIAVARAKAAVNLINAYGRAGKVEEAEKLYASMAELGHEPEIAVERAKAAVNLSTAYGTAGKLEEAEKLYASMAELGHEPEIAVQRAKAAFNLINAYGRAGKVEEAEKLYASMAELGHEPEIAVWRAKAAFNLSITYRKAGKVEEAWAVYASMTELGSTPEVLEIKAKLKEILDSWE